MSTTVTSKGQVTIPKKVRDLLGLVPGSAVDFEVSGERQVTLRPADRTRRPKNRFARLRGRATVRMRTEDVLALTREPKSTLAQLLAAFDPGLHSGEAMPTAPVGNEVA
jgi:antitoxin PrlF